MEIIPYNGVSLWYSIFFGENNSHIFQSHLREVYDSQFGGDSWLTGGGGGERRACRPITTTTSFDSERERKTGIP